MIVSVPVHSQELEPPTISVAVHLVVLHASIQDKKGLPVSGLREHNFKVQEDGRPQTIRAFQAEDAPVAVGLVVDNSGSMTRKRPDVVAAAVAFVHASNPADQLFLVNFNDRVTLAMPDTKLWPSSAADLERALLTPVLQGKTALYDAVTVALAHIRTSTIQKKVLVVISDGGDNASQHTLDQVLRDVGRSDVVVYSIGLLDEFDPDLNPRALQRIASASGGQTFLPPTADRTTQLCERIAKEIRAQYTISYSPLNQTFGGEFRRVRVTAADDHGRKLDVRTRDGYIASPDRQTSKDGPR
jgi:VWFA-related protein